MCMKTVEPNAVPQAQSRTAHWLEGPNRLDTAVASAAPARGADYPGERRHAIEAEMGYGNWLHGEAVAAGTMMAAELSRRMGWLGEGDIERIEALFRRAGLPTVGPALEPAKYLDLMQHDKKVQNGKMNLVLLEQIGRAVSTNAALMSDVTNAIACRT